MQKCETWNYTYRLHSDCPIKISRLSRYISIISFYQVIYSLFDIQISRELYDGNFMIYVSSGCSKRTDRGLAVLQIMYDWHHSNIVLPYAVNRSTEFFNPAFTICVFDPWASLCSRNNPFFNPSCTTVIFVRWSE